jgi:hypothetical protein
VSPQHPQFCVRPGAVRPELGSFWRRRGEDWVRFRRRTSRGGFVRRPIESPARLAHFPWRAVRFVPNRGPSPAEISQATQCPVRFVPNGEGPGGLRFVPHRDRRLVRRAWRRGPNWVRFAPRRRPKWLCFAPRRSPKWVRSAPGRPLRRSPRPSPDSWPLREVNQTVPSVRSAPALGRPSRRSEFGSGRRSVRSIMEAVLVDPLAVAARSPPLPRRGHSLLSWNSGRKPAGIPGKTRGGRGRRKKPSPRPSSRSRHAPRAVRPPTEFLSPGGRHAPRACYGEE